MRKVITVGAATIDCLMKSDSFKVMKNHEVTGGLAICEVLGGKMEADDGELCTGGGGSNVAVGLRRLGESVKVITRIGDDILADMVAKDLDKENVNMELLQRGKGKTGLSAILVAKNGARSIITYRGESGNITSNAINWNEVSKADWIQISSLGGDIELLEDLIGFAKDRSIKVGVNPGKGELEHRDKLIKLLPNIDFINLNRMESSVLWNTDFENEEVAIRKFIQNGSKLVAITDGKRGANIITPERWIRMEAFSNKSIDDTGAGDAFVSGAVHGIINGFKIEDILKIGLANGGSVVMSLGAKRGLIYKNNISKWIDKQLKSTEITI